MYNKPCKAWCLMLIAKNKGKRPHCTKVFKARFLKQGFSETSTVSASDEIIRCFISCYAAFFLPSHQNKLRMRHGILSNAKDHTQQLEINLRKKSREILEYPKTCDAHWLRLKLYTQKMCGHK